MARFFLRSDPEYGIKLLIDEILPLAAFLKHLERPGLSIKCQHFVGSQNYDAKITMSGYFVDKGIFKTNYYVETTVARNPDDYLIREALARDGYISGYDVKRVRMKGNDRIIGKMVARDIDAPVKDAINWIKTSFQNKYSKKEAYLSPCFLLVQVEPLRTLALSEWLAIIVEVRKAINPKKFQATYLVNWKTNFVSKA